MNQTLLHGEVVDSCSACGGRWFDSSELSLVLGRIVDMRPSETMNQPVSTNRNCPRCSVQMRVADYAYDSGISISRCDPCSGVWLDHGQLECIAHCRAGSQEINALADAHSVSLRCESRWSFLFHLIRSRLASVIVAAIFVLTAFLFRGPEVSLVTLAFVLIPLVCIWFPDAMGKLTNVSFGLGGPTISSTTSGELVAIGGWILLLGPLVLLFFLG